MTFCVPKTNHLEPFNISCKLIMRLRKAVTFVKIIFQFCFHHQSYLGLPLNWFVFCALRRELYNLNRSPYCSPVFFYMLFVMCYFVFYSVKIVFVRRISMIYDGDTTWSTECCRVKYKFCRYWNKSLLHIVKYNPCFTSRFLNPAVVCLQNLICLRYQRRTQMFVKDKMKKVLKLNDHIIK